MKKILLSLFVCLNAIAVFAQENTDFDILNFLDQSVGTGISANGNFIVGTLLLEDLEGAYIWDLVTPNFTPIIFTSYEDAITPTGISNSQIVAGLYRNTEETIIVTIEGQQVEIPVLMGALYLGDMIFPLGIGDLTLEDLVDANDGSYAMCISSDDSAIGGYTLADNVYTPCAWRFSINTFWYEYEKYALPENATGGQILSFSGDGSIAAGVIIKDEVMIPAVWTSPTNCIVLGEELNASLTETAVKISDNGKYVVSPISRTQGILYDVENDSYTLIDRFEQGGIMHLAGVTDNGIVFGSYVFTDINFLDVSRSFFWSEDFGLLDFDYYFKTFSPNAVLREGLSFAYEDEVFHELIGVSADGKVVTGLFRINGQIFNWKLTATEDIEVINLNLPQNFKAEVSERTNVILTWEAPEIDDEYTVTGYNIYRGTQIIETTDAETFTSEDTDLGVGYYLYSISAIYGEQESQRSSNIEIVIVDNYDIPFLDSFESQNITDGFWQVIGNQVEDPFKGTWGVADFLSIAGSFSVGHYIYGQCERYDNTLLSKPLDATELDNLYLSYGFRLFRNVTANCTETITPDTMDIEIGINDEWTLVKRYITPDVSSAWNANFIDIKEMVGDNIFRLRFRAYGEGTNITHFLFDNIRVDYEKYEAPEGLTGVQVGRKADLMWKNNIGGYELSYMPNTALSSFLFIEDDPIEYIAAIAFEAADLTAYNGMYLNSISIPFLNLETPEDFGMELVVFVDDDEIISQAVTKEIIPNTMNVFAFDSPHQIDASKNLKFGIKMVRHNLTDAVLPYHATSNPTPYKSDLYSMDGGETWISISEEYGAENSNLLMIWDITGNVSNEENNNEDYDDNLLSYNIFKDGERLSDGLVYKPYFTDEDFTADACYEVWAYYFDGSVSLVSEQFCLDYVNQGGTNLTDKNADVIRIYPNPTASVINIEGELNKAVLYDLNGKAVMETLTNQMNVRNVADGIYLMRIESKEGNSHQKVIIRK